MLALKQLRKIDVEEIGLNETHVRRNTRRKRRSEVAIDFDGDDACRPAPPAGAVSAPRPGPISRNVSSAVGRERRAISLRDPGRLEEVLAESLPRPRETGPIAVLDPSSSVRPERFAAPVALLDLLDLLLAQAEVVADLVNQRLADHGAHLVLVLAVLFDRSLEDA